MVHKTMIRWIGWAVAGLAALSGCSGRLDDDPGDHLGRAAQAFGEATCETAVPNATETVFLTSSVHSASHVSFDGNYGTSSCTDTYLVEYAGGGASGNIGLGLCAVDVVGAWGEWFLPSTQADCEKAHVRTHVWADMGGWSDQGATHYRGVWNGNSCAFAHEVTNTLMPTWGYATKVRVGVEAFYCSLANVNDCAGAGGTKLHKKAGQYIRQGACQIPSP